MNQHTAHSSIFQKINSFYPLELIKSQFKFNLLSVFFWLFMFAVVNKSVGFSFGLPYLFYSPEYLGKINGWSFYLLGISIGGFTTAYNTYSYIKFGQRYPFLATVYRPFFMFCVNNSVIPLLFITFYLIKMSLFQAEEELASPSQLIIYNLAFLGGFTSFILFSMFYFFPTSKNKHYTDEDKSDEFATSVFVKKEKWYRFVRYSRNKNFIYVGSKFKLYTSRSVKHIDKEVLEMIYAKNRINATIFEILTIITFIFISFYKDDPVMELPAAMCVILLLTLLHMVFSFITSWFGNWAYPFLFFMFISMNYISSHSTWFHFKNYAYGLNYDQDKLVKFSPESLIQSASGNEDESHRNYIQILENWKKNTGEKKPKMIIVNCSGGGSRNALWTFHILRSCNLQLNGKLNKQLQMITGASGGMVGASYYRELVLRKKRGEIDNIYDYKYFDNLGKDLLNKMSFSASTNDIFSRLQTYQINNQKYSKDRGYAWEEQFHKNTENILRHNLGYYAEAEKSAETPIMIFTPTIINDGRKLLMSTQNLNFLSNVSEDLYPKRSAQNIDFQTYFKNNDPNNICFSTVLRANATFPMVMPMMSMPTQPEMLLMDAGIRDNIGISTTLNMLDKMSDWIKKNTSGVIILEIRDTKHFQQNDQYEDIQFGDKLTRPFGNILGNLFITQDFNQEELVSFAQKSYPFKMDLVSFCLLQRDKNEISLSWHLTKSEKKKVNNAIYFPENQKSLKRLKELLK
ncbi:MAG: patatin-like phospholipase family protein [Bacteroidota bacterium]